MAGTARNVSGFDIGMVPDALVPVLREELNKVVADLERLRAAVGDGNGVVTSAPTLAIGTSSAAEVKVAAFTVEQAGGTRTISSAETAFTATTHDIADPDTDPREAYFTLSVDKADTITITKGSDAAEDAAVKIAGPPGELVIGWVLVQHNGSAIFNATTDDLDAAHITATYEDAPLNAAANMTAATVSVVPG